VGVEVRGGGAVGEASSGVEVESGSFDGEKRPRGVSVADWVGAAGGVRVTRPGMAGEQEGRVSKKKKVMSNE